MRKSILIISCLLYFTSAIADDPCQSASGPYGPMTCSGGVTPSITANGMVTIDGTLVQNSAEINGHLTAKQTTFNTLTVNGQVTLQNSTVQSTTKINGELSATDCYFNDTLTVASNNIELMNSKTADIVINSSDDGVDAPQTITLSGKTIVDGDITFSTEGGVVNIGPDAKITGKVIGGTVIQQPVLPTPVTAAPK